MNKQQRFESAIKTMAGLAAKHETQLDPKRVMQEFLKSARYKPMPSRLKSILLDALCWLIAGSATAVMLAGLLWFIKDAGPARFVVVAVCGLTGILWAWVVHT